jgi:hypothetical protein
MSAEGNIKHRPLPLRGATMSHWFAETLRTHSGMALFLTP